MTTQTIYKAKDRGRANHGWLRTAHSFSFAGYFNPDQMNFGNLRVLNDDWVKGGEGFGRHPHRNMEIITIPLSGSMEHGDSMGNRAVISKGEVQIMSAGTGIEHSEYNHSAVEPVEFLQIWIIPNQKDVEPRYDQITLDLQENSWQQIISPDKNDEGSWIHQDAWMKMGVFSAGTEAVYKLNSSKNGAYIMVIEGSAETGETVLNRRDAIGFTGSDEVKMTALQDNTTLLVIEVPMELSVN